LIPSSIPSSSEANDRHKVALEILVSGYVEAYIEFFQVTEQHSEWHNDADKLYILQINLARAEDATRKDDFLTACNSYNQLGAYFETTGDLDIAQQFYMSAYKSVSKTADNFAKRVELCCQLGLLSERQGIWKFCTGYQTRNISLNRFRSSVSAQALRGNCSRPNICVAIFEACADTLAAFRCAQTRINNTFSLFIFFNLNSQRIYPERPNGFRLCIRLHENTM
jgi:hypothetical protein